MRPPGPTTADRSTAAQRRNVASEQLLAEVVSAGATLSVLSGVLEPLLRHERLFSRGDLLITLRTFVEHDASVQAAADVLCVHRNTIVDRLRRVESVLGRSTRKGQDRLLVGLAVVAHFLPRPGVGQAR